MPHRIGMNQPEETTQSWPTCDDNHLNGRSKHLEFSLNQKEKMHHALVMSDDYMYEGWVIVCIV